MILTITPNPSIDLLFTTDTLIWDDANRVEMPRRRAGGQGINVTRATRALGGESTALALLGGHAGAELAALLDDDGTPYIPVHIDAETRTFVAVRERATGRSLLINPRGPLLTEDDRARLIEAIDAACDELRPEWIVCSGSIPRGIGNDLYAYVVRSARARGIRCIADGDGEALERAVREGCDMLAPNQHEAERLMNQPIVSVQDAGVAATALLGAASKAIVKLGERGAVLADAHGSWHAALQDHAAVRFSGCSSAVGAGDAFLAGFLTAEKSGAPPYEALRRAVAAGAAVLSSSGSVLLSREDYDDVLARVVVMPL